MPAGAEKCGRLWPLTNTGKTDLDSACGNKKIEDFFLPIEPDFVPVLFFSISELVSPFCLILIESNQA